MLKQAEKGGKDFMLTEVQCGLLSAREIDGLRRSAKDMQFSAILLLVHQLKNFCRQLDGLFFDGFARRGRNGTPALPVGEHAIRPDV